MGKVGTNNAFSVAGIVEAPPPRMLHVSMHTPSSTPVIQNRNRLVNYGSVPPPTSFGSMPPPSFGALPLHLVANAQRQTSQEMDALHRKLAALYTPEQFEPTPINPNLQLSMHENTRLESKTPGLGNESFQSRLPIRPIQRSDSSGSLDIKKVFSNETPKPRGKMDELSQQLSNLSFSVGDIAAIHDDGNLSALFDESMRVTDNGNAELKSSQCNQDEDIDALFDESMRVRDNGNAKLKSLQYNNKSMNMSLGWNDMSLSDLAGESNFAVDSSLGNFMSTTSISRVFDESTDTM